MMRHEDSHYGTMVICLAALCFMAAPAWAQEAPPVAPAPATPPTAAPVVLQQPPAAKPPTPVEAAKPPAPLDPNSLTSLFFSPVEKEAITQARKQYSGQGVPEESEADLLDQLQGIKEVKKSREDVQEKFYAQFYLESLIYHTPNDWLVWLKSNEANKKFTPISLAETDIGLKVLRVDKEDITFEWSPKNWLRVSNAFKGNSPAISLDQNRHVVVFTLRVNQTLSTSDMQIAEGVVSTAPVVDAPLLVPVKPLPVPAEVGKSPADKVQSAPAEKRQPGILSLYKDLESVDKKP